MKLLFKQRIFSWLDSYDIYDEAGNAVFSVEGKLSWGHKLEIHDAAGNTVGVVKERIFKFLPTFDIYLGDNVIGSVTKEFTFFKPRYTLDFLDWQIDGDIFGWDYTVTDGAGQTVAVISKRLFNWSDTYELDIADGVPAIYVLMAVLAIDAANCSSGKD